MKKLPKGHIKNGDYQKIINIIPPHLAFVSLFGGYCTISQVKAPAKYNIINTENDKKTVKFWKKYIKEKNLQNYLIKSSSPIELLEQIRTGDSFISAFKKEKVILFVNSETISEKLLSLLETMNTEDYKIIIFTSHLPIANWNSINLKNNTIFYNYELKELHQLDKIGDNKKKRQDFKRKKEGYLRKFAKMDPIERNSILKTLNQIYDAD